MTDVEELLRETLTDPRYRLDPEPAMYDVVRERAWSHRRRRVTYLSAAAAAIAVVVAGSVVGVQQSNRHRVTPLATPTVTSSQSPSVSTQGTTGTPIDLGPGFGTVVDVKTSGEGLYVLTMLGQATSVAIFSPTGGQFKAKAQGPLGTPAGLAIGDGKVWAWSQDSRNLKAYDAHTLKPLADFTMPYVIFNVVAADGIVFASSDSGLYYSAEGATLAAPTAKVPGIDMAYGLAADPARNRVVVGVMTSGWGARIDAVDTRTLEVTKGAQTQLGKESIAVVGDDVWVGGYASGDTTRLIHLDARTLKVIGSSPMSDMLGPGAVVWPGQHVLWVSAGGDASISCVNPRNGSVLAEWSAARGPVASVGGSAYALNPNVVPLVLTNACTG
jgi:hypothetical protein